MRTADFEKLKDVIDVNSDKLIFLGGAAATGKTTMAIKVAEYFSANQNLAVALFDLENNREMIKKKITNYNSNLYIYDIPLISINDICSKVRDLKKQTNIKLVIIDYLQLISYDKSQLLSRDREIENIVKIFKKLTEELHITILVTSHIREHRENETSNLKYSNDILELIDNVLFLK